MKNKLIICVVFLATIKIVAQVNLVLNPSFEEMNECPLLLDEIYKAMNWGNLSSVNSTCNADLFSSCSPINTPPHVPNYLQTSGAIYFQYPRTGNNFILLELYGGSSIQNFRNYVTSLLNDKLINKMEYCSKLYVNLSNMSKFRINKIGILFDNNTLPTNNDACYALNINPSISSNPAVMLDDTLGWMKIEGVYTANGTETNIVIGNFSSDANTIAQSTFFLTSREFAEYAIDDVSVIPIDVKAWAGNDVTLCVGDTVRLGRPQEVGLECLWYTTTNTTPFSYNSDIVFTATEPGTYTLIQKMDNCQISFDTVTVTVVEDCNDLLTLPNVFTPNGDGTNDVFSFSLKNGTVKSFAVYNRWGNLVHLTSNISNFTFISWDGRTTAGEPCNDGVYFYVLEYTDAKGELKTKRGYVSLMR